MVRHTDLPGGPVGSAQGFAHRAVLAGAMLAALTQVAAAQSIEARRSFADSAGRMVVVPARVERVYAAGPPAAILLYTLAPDRLIGWTRAPTAEEAAFMPERYVRLPTLGRLTGRGNTANVEVVLQARPDLIFDYGTVRPTFASLADRVQEQTNIPYVLIDGALDKIPESYRLLGRLVGATDRGEELAQRAERILGDIRDGVAAVPADRRPRVYYGRGPRGLQTGLDGSINMEAIAYVGAINVAAAAGAGGIVNVSIEQILLWQPEVVLTTNSDFRRAIDTDPLWQAVPAVRAKRVHLDQGLPFGWIDFPPSVNRLIGLQWLAHLLYPDRFPNDLRAVTRAFYRDFLHVALNDAQLDRLLVDTSGPAR